MSPRRLVVAPGPPLAGRVRPPGDKSITHRAYILALLADGRSVIENANPGADCQGTLACCLGLGLEATTRGQGLELEGRALRLAEPDGVLACGNSGTTLRLLAGVAAGQPFLSVLAGDASLNRRPVDRVIDPLRRMGARLKARERDRLPPLVIEGAALRGIDYTLPQASAQVASCVLLAALAAQGTTTIHIPGPARDHTERMLGSCGVTLESMPLSGGGRSVAVTGPQTPRGFSLRVPGDFSGAAFFLAAAAATPGSSVTAEGVSLNPTRTGLLDVLEAMGARIERHSVRIEAGEELGDVTVTGPDRLSGFDIPAEWVPRLLDEVPAWTVAAVAARGCSRLRGAAELRVKESDRLTILGENLTRLGITARQERDGIEIEGGVVAGGTVSAAGDHRIAMAFAALGVNARAPLAIEDAENIDTSFPDFVSAFRGLGGRVGEDLEEARR